MRVLAIVRCGDKSLHQSWVGAESVHREFDVAVSYFGNDPNFQSLGATYFHRKKGGKWDGIFDFFECHPEALATYDYFWLPDDDIRAEPKDVNQLISLVGEYDLEVCQPSLSYDSYYSHFITLHSSRFKVRYTNFVEIMAPFLSRDFMAKSLAKLQGTKSGFGLDLTWAKWAEELGVKIGIVDAVQIHHTRPVGGALHSMMKKSGSSAMDELSSELSSERISGNAQLNGVSIPRVVVQGGVDLNGRVVSLPRKIALLAASGFDARPKLVQTATLVSVARYVLKHVI